MMKNVQNHSFVRKS